jgi:hypothetical protein
MSEIVCNIKIGRGSKACKEELQKLRNTGR